MLRAVILTGVVLLSVHLAGCANPRLNMENFSRIDNGMTARDVVAILGEPDDEEGGGIAVGEFDASARVMKWDSGDKLIAVTFLGGTVRAKFQKGL